MLEENLNDFLVGIIQDLKEAESTMKVLKDSANNNCNIEMNDVANTLELIIAKINSAKYLIERHVDEEFSN
jgi:hypothetical protein